MLGVSGTTQYINPDYIQPLPTSLDTKNSPLALLAQTCSSIGKDNSPTSAPPSSSSSSSSSLLSSSSSSSSSKLNQHQQIHSSSTTSDKKDSSQKLLNGKDQSSRLKSSDPNADHNGVHQHHNHHHHQHHSSSGGSSYNHYKMSSGKSSYSERLSKENGRSSTGRLSASPPKNKLSSGNGYGLNGNKNHLSKSDASAYRGALSYYGNGGKEDYLPGTLPSVHHHHHHQQQQQSSKLSPSSSSSPLQNLKMQQELFSAAFGMGYPPWMLGQSPFMPPAFDPFFLSAAALSSQHKQHLLQLHQQLFSSLSGYPPSETGSSGLPLGGTGQTGGSSQKHDTDAGHSPTSKSSTVSHNSPASSNPLLSGASLSSLFPAHIPGHSSSQGQQLSPSSHPYACNWLQPGSDFCGKRFSTYEELLEHLKTHVAGSSPGQGGTADEGRLFPPSFFPFMFGMAPPFALPSGYNSSYLLQQQQQQQQAAAASLFQRSYSPSTPSSSSSSLSTTSTNSRYHPYKQPALSSASVFPSLLPFPTPSSSTVASQFSSLMPPYMGYGFPYPMYGSQKLSETAAGP